ncbi:hypothetical protein MTR_2g027770 [Medicago truncatula]|uniref:Uncharacterized protein n=1 Tax=Medicago truncatula TaxID=3880 RepID=G7ISN3_MEDTR|nr:hypothetical protein MTR_2g027770 [Medicago truncatula]
MAIPLGFEQDIWLANSLITLYSKSGELPFSILCKSWSWSSCVTGIPTHAQLLISRTMPDEVTFMGLLLAFSHAGLINQGRRTFYERDEAVLVALLAACKIHGDSNSIVANSITMIVNYYMRVFWDRRKTFYFEMNEPKYTQELE